MMRGDPIRIDDPAEMDALLPIVCRLLEFLDKQKAAQHVRDLRAQGGASRVITIARGDMPERLDILALARLIREETRKGTPMIRVRFYANEQDWRPIKWPPPGPCWCTGHGEGFSVVVAYVCHEAQIKEFWPEATEIDVHKRDCEPEFSDRFPQPDWWRKS